MNMMRWGGVVIAAMVISGCATSHAVTQSGNITAGTYHTAALVPQDGNSSEVDGYVKDALAAHEITVLPSKPAGTKKAEDVDLLVSYLDVWRWDVHTYLLTLRIDLFDARSGALLVSGTWNNSLFHGFQRGKDEAKELLVEMIAPIRGTAK